MSAGDPTGEFVPVQPHEAADHHPPVLANHIRALQREVRSGFEMITTRLETMMDRFAERQEDHAIQLAELQKHRHDSDRRHKATETRLALLEAAKKKAKRK